MIRELGMGGQGQGRGTLSDGDYVAAMGPAIVIEPTSDAEK